MEKNLVSGRPVTLPVLFGLRLGAEQRFKAKVFLFWIFPPPLILPTSKRFCTFLHQNNNFKCNYILLSNGG